MNQNMNQNSNIKLEALPYSYKTINRLGVSSDARAELGVYISDSAKHLQAVPAEDILCLIVREGSVIPFDFRVPIYTVSVAWFNRIKQTKHAQGILAIIRKPTWRLTAEYRYWVVCDTVQNPGNLGAIIRSVSAFLPNAILACCGGGSDAFHPDCVRASAGLVHGQPVVNLADNSLPLDRLWYALDPRGTHALNSLKQEKKLGIILGSEGHGIRESLHQHCQPVPIRIPTRPHVESLNVAVTAGIIAAHLSPV
ncbi:hypothetical protein CL648_01525 [bacterium]|nr:hypothetical protein [bacterium]|tara:strand:+ start:1585 stop:2343 length:759 start_codon:yes stop_codon:yes gene_type:complete